MIIISPEHETYPVTYTAYCKSMDNRNTRLRGPLLWLLCATSFGFVVVQLDVTIVNVALPQIGSHLHAGVAGLQWVVDAYTLSFAALLISAGVIGDRFGSRRAYLAGFAIFSWAGTYSLSQNRPAENPIILEPYV